MTVSSTVSQVPQLAVSQPPPQDEDPQPESQALAPHGLQLDAQGAEQQELTLLPQQLPACAETVIRTAAASDKNKRINKLLRKTRRSYNPDVKAPPHTPQACATDHFNKVTSKLLLHHGSPHPALRQGPLTDFSQHSPVSPNANHERIGRKSPTHHSLLIIPTYMQQETFKTAEKPKKWQSPYDVPLWKHCAD